MPDAVFDTHEIDALLNKAAKVLEPAQLLAMMQRNGARVGVRGESYVSAYPPSPNGRPLALYYDLNGRKSIFKSRKQQGYFFWALAHGVITLPYPRTGKLGASMTSQCTVDSDGVLIEWGTVMKYGPYVVGGPDVQSHYHQTTGWTALQADIDPHADELLTDFGEGVQAYLDGALA